MYVINIVIEFEGNFRVIVLRSPYILGWCQYYTYMTGMCCKFRSWRPVDWLCCYFGICFFAVRAKVPVSEKKKNGILVANNWCGIWTYVVSAFASCMLDGSGKLFVSGRVKQRRATMMAMIENMIKGIVGSTFLPWTLNQWKWIVT